MFNAAVLCSSGTSSNSSTIWCRECGPRCGIIGTSPSGLYKRPSYHVMKLYALHHKPVPLKVEGVPDGVDLAACASDDGKSVCVFAVNSRAEPVEISLDLSEHAGKVYPVESEAVYDTLDARQPDVMNHWSAPDRVRPVKQPISGDKVTLTAFSVSAIECLRVHKRFTSTSD